MEDPRSPTSSPGVTVWYDNSGYHALPAYLNALTNARLSRLLGDQYEVTTVNNPVKFSKYGLNSISLCVAALTVFFGEIFVRCHCKAICPRKFRGYRL